MILLLLEWLKDWGWKIPQAFTYTSTRMILGALTSLILSIFLGPLCIRLLYRFKMGQPIREKECPTLASLHANKKDTPTMGGLLLLFSMLTSLILWMDSHSLYTWAMLWITLTLGIIGAIDDGLKVKYQNSKGLAGKKKFILQSLATLALAAVFLFPTITELFTQTLGISSPQIHPFKGQKTLATSLDTSMVEIYLPFFKHALTSVPSLLMCLWWVFVVTGSSNAVNLTDGLDGLAAGCLLIACSVFAIFAFVTNNRELANYLHTMYFEGSGELSIYLLSTCGALLGFLWFNGHPAQVFMGDVGSLTLGGILGAVSLMLRREFVLAIVGGIFVAETVSVILQVASFKLRRKRVFLCAPLHHHFEYKGWPETKVVMRFWILSILFALLGLITLKFQ